MPSTDIQAMLDQTFADIRTRHPVYGDVIDQFQELVRTGLALSEKFSGHEFAWTGLDSSRFNQGAPVLAHVDLPECDELLRESLEQMAPAVARAFSMEREMDILSRAVESGDADPSGLARSMVENRAEPFERTAEKIELPAPVLAFAMGRIAGPVLSGMARSLNTWLESGGWTQGTCPFCGQAPAVASLERFENKRNEELVGGGGGKRLTCSLCSHEWGFRRDACPNCGETDHHKRELIFAQGRNFERIEACHGCGSYVLCVDLRELVGNPVMEAMPLGLMHLDIIARSKNLSPLAATPWNTPAGPSGKE